MVLVNVGGKRNVFWLPHVASLFYSFPQGGVIAVPKREELETYMLETVSLHSFLFYHYHEYMIVSNPLFSLK